MAIRKIIGDIRKRRTPQPTTTVTNLPPQKKPDVTFVDVGREAPKGYEFVDESGKSQGSTIRTGGYTVVGRTAGGSGGSIVPGSQSGEVTPEIAYKLEGGKTFPSGATKPQGTTISPQVQQQIARQQQIQKMSEAQRVTRQEPSQAQKAFLKERAQQGEVPLSPYVTRKTPTVKGYTSSGKPIMEKGEGVYVNPFAEQYGQVKERKATPEELSFLEAEEKKQEEQRIAEVYTKVSPKLYGEYLSVKDIQQVKPSDIPEFMKLSKGQQKNIQTKVQEIKFGTTYNPEDISSYKQLATQGQFSSIIRKSSYDFGSLVSNIGTKLGIKQSPATSAKVRAFVGEGALFAVFAPTFTTTAQTMVKLNAPTKVKFVGVSQTGKKGLVQTDVVFTAKKAGTTYKGIATGVGETKQLYLGGKQVKGFYEVFGQARGRAVEFSLKIPKRVGYKGQMAFASQERGFAWVVGKKKLASFTQGAMGIGLKKGGEGFKYYSLGAQYAGKKGITATFGGTISEVGKANYVGLLFPIKTQPKLFIPLSAKGGQILINAPKTLIKYPTFTIAQQGSLVLTKSSVQAFATTIPATAVVSYATPTASLLRIKPSTSFISPKTIFSIKTGEREQIKFNTRELQITKEQTLVKPRNIFSSSSITETKQQQKETQKQIVKQPLKLKQVQKLYVPRTPFSFQKAVPKKILPPFKIGGAQPKQAEDNLTVFLRRFGKFKPIAKTSTVKQAFDIGKFRAKTTLGATFKVEGTRKQPEKITGFKTKKTKKGVLFIEEPKFRLSTPTEKAEIQTFKRVQTGRGRYGRF